MVEHLRGTERVGAVATPTRVRKVQRDRRQERRERKADEQKRAHVSESREDASEEAEVQPQESNSSTGQRINVVI